MTPRDLRLRSTTRILCSYTSVFKTQNIIKAWRKQINFGAHFSLDKVIVDLLCLVSRLGLGKSKLLHSREEKNLADGNAIQSSLNFSTFFNYKI